MICHDCTIGKHKLIVPKGHNQSVHVIVCPFNGKYYKLWDDVCNHEDKRKQTEESQ